MKQSKTVLLGEAIASLWDDDPDMYEQLLVHRLRDYLPETNDELIAAGVEALQNLDDMAIVDLRTIARTVGFGENPDLELPLQPRGSACLPAFRASRTLFLSVWWSASVACRLSWRRPLRIYAPWMVWVRLVPARCVSSSPAWRRAAWRSTSNKSSYEKPPRRRLSGTAAFSCLTRTFCIMM